jgi:hypothetical protein
MWEEEYGRMRKRKEEEGGGGRGPSWNREEGEWRNKERGTRG